MATVASATAHIVKFIPPIAWNSETQTVILAILCFVGAWVLVTKLIQIIFSILWPLVIIGGLLILVPNFSASWVTEDIPNCTQTVADWTKRLTGEMNINFGRKK